MSVWQHDPIRALVVENLVYLFIAAVLSVSNLLICVWPFLYTEELQVA